MKAVVLSAGLGTRLRPFTENLAKPAVPFFTLPMLGYSHYYLKAVGVNDFYVNTHHCPDSIHAAVNSIKQTDDQFTYNQEDPILGSGGALLAFKEALTEDFFMLNADSVFIFNNPKALKSVMQQHKALQSLATIVVMPHPEAGKSMSACWLDEDNFVVGFGPDTPQVGARPFHFFGSQVISPDLLGDLPEGESNILYDLITPHLKNKKVKAVIFDDMFWYETGNIKDYMAATSLLAKNIEDRTPLGEAFLKLLKHYSPNLKISRSPLVISEDTVELPNNISVDGFLVLGKNCQLPAHDNPIKVSRCVFQSDSCFPSNQTLTELLILR